MLAAQFLISILFMSLAFSSSLLHAAPFAYELEAVRLQFNREGAVFARFSEPCGAVFAGFLYRDGAAGELQVAAVVRRSHARCLSLKGPITVPLPLVLASRYAAVQSLNPANEAPIMAALPLQNLHRTHSAGRDTVQAVYTSECGTALGLLVQSDADGLHFHALESSRARPGMCQRKSAVISIAQLQWDARNTPKIQLDPSPHLATDFTLRRVPVQLTARAEQTTTRSFSLRFLRQCNEAPVGLVRREQGSQLSLSMLVAHYPAMKCPTAGPQRMWTHWPEAVTMSQNLRIRTLRQASSEELRLVRPSSYRFMPGTDAAVLQVSSLSSCTPDLGLVSHSSRDGLAIGILQETGTGPCKSPLKKVRYDFTWNAASTVEIKPLLLGT